MPVTSPPTVGAVNVDNPKPLRSEAEAERRSPFDVNVSAAVILGGSLAILVLMRWSLRGHIGAEGM